MVCEKVWNTGLILEGTTELAQDNRKTNSTHSSFKVLGQAKCLGNSENKANCKVIRESSTEEGFEEGFESYLG